MSSQPRLSLEPLSLEAHLQDFHRYISNEECMAWSPSLHTLSLSETRARMIKNALPSPEKPSMENYAIMLESHAESGEARKVCIGSVGTWGIDEGFDGGRGAAELQYGMHPDYWGKGYGSRALGMFLELYWGADRTKPSKDIIRAEVDALNAPSMGLIKKMGFTRGEDKKRSYQLGSDIRDETGVWRDTVVWSLERPEVGKA